MTIQRNFLTMEEFRSQNMTGAIVLSIAKFHELTVHNLTEKGFRHEVLDDHKEVAFILRKLAYRMDPSLKEKMDERREKQKEKQKHAEA